jgi:hypothetical protein
MEKLKPSHIIVATVGMVIGIVCTQLYINSKLDFIVATDAVYIPCAEPSERKPGCWDGITLGMVSKYLDTLPTSSWPLLTSLQDNQNIALLKFRLSECVSYEQRAFGTFNVNESLREVKVTAPKYVLDECVSRIFNVSSDELEMSLQRQINT